MSTARYVVADVFDGLERLEPDSVDFVMTSPPFLALRSYLPADHPDKGREIGSEPTPAAFLDALLDVVEACDRVLAPHGSLVFELGDSFAGNGGRGEASFDWADRQYQGTSTRAQSGAGWPSDKSLCLVPQLFAASLAYGRNLLRPERVTPRWRVRNVVAWCRPNPPVGALGDKYRPATSYLTVACKSRDRYFDLDAVRTHDGPGGNATRRSSLNRTHPGEHTQDERELRVLDNPAGAPPLDFWVIPTHPYPGAHYATFPPDLCVRPIKSMCPEKVCTECGEPSRRIVEHERTFSNVHPSAGRSEARTPKAGPMDTDYEVTRETLGWSDCGHDAYRRGVVLDPFAGSGTTLAVATGLGRDAIGIDLDERNAWLARDRIGMFMEIDGP